MRSMRLFMATLFCICLVSCYEVNEEIVINEDGSGTYVSKMDMSQLIEMLQTFAGDEALNKDGMDKLIDTTIMMKDILDTAKDVTAEQKELLKDGKLSLQMNVKEKLFKLGINVPYKNYSGLQQLMAGESGSGAGLSSVLKNVFGKGDEQPNPDGPKEPDMDDFSKVYDVTIKNGLISKKLNEEKFKQLTDRPEMAQVKQFGGSGIEILYTTTFKLPRPVKKTDNPLLKLSDDKKTVTLKYNLLEILDSPDKFSFTIEY